MLHCMTAVFTPPLLRVTRAREHRHTRRSTQTQSKDSNCDLSVRGLTSCRSWDSLGCSTGASSRSKRRKLALKLRGRVVYKVSPWISIGPSAAKSTPQTSVTGPSLKTVASCARFLRVHRQRGEGGQLLLTKGDTQQVSSLLRFCSAFWTH